MTKGKKVTIAVIASVVGLLLACLVGLLVSGSLYGIPPFGGLRDARLKKLPGNSEEYAIEHVEPLESSPLKGMDICFLGSSVTLGASSLSTSFVEYLAKRNEFTYTKEAVSGTTLVDDKNNSYISRMMGLDANEEYDLFIVQLSTNDASQKKPLGEMRGKGAEYDTHTVCGAIEYIISYVEETWNCPIVFYTNSYYENAAYAEMVSLLERIRQEYGIFVIDLYSDPAFNAISEEQRALYMEDKIHPTRAGYLEWWTPRMEQDLYSFVR